MVESLIYIVIGVLMGMLVSNLIPGFLVKRKMLKVERAVVIELEEIQYKFVNLVHSLLMVQGNLNHDNLAWLEPYYENYQGIRSKSDNLETIRTLVKLSPDELVEFMQKHGSQGKLKSVRKFQLAYLNANLDHLTCLSESRQRRLLDINSQLSSYNEIVDEVRKYYAMTFDTNVTPEKQQLAVEAIFKLYDAIITLSRIFIESIEDYISSS